MAREPIGNPGIPLRVAGMDLGKATARLVVGRVAPGGGVAIEVEQAVAHEGRPHEALCALYRAHGVAGTAVLAATGLHADELDGARVARLPEEACLEAALPLLPAAAGPVNVVSIGARGYSVLARAADGRVTFLENDKCSSGTGETMLRLAARFGLSLAEADRLALSADTSVPITARCSVFAKSEMTHFANQGRPADALFRGYFGAVAAYVIALLGRVRVPGPILVVGGPSRLEALVAALAEAAGQPVSVPEHATSAEALGALVLAAELAPKGRAALPPDPAELLRPLARGFRVLPAPREHAERVHRLEAPPPEPGAERAPSVLGLDLGSTGSKAVLTRVADGRAVLDLYDQTRGNPALAAQRLVAAILPQAPDVRAIGVTGSGREAVAQVLRASFPELGARLVVENEIVAHATAAIRCDPDRGRSLSVVEIGGQDAKFIQIAGGQIVESDLNKACSAGTGSFLEEQALLYGLPDVSAFTRLATEARRPPDLGQMCTVFVADAAAAAAGEGFALADLFGGFQYAVIHNYLHRVMGQRTFGERIFFQGKPATGPALGWTLAAVSGREVWVPPNPGAMGAWGIGLLALAQLGPAALAVAERLPLEIVAGVRVVGQSELQCRDPGCATFCSIARTHVDVGGTVRTVLSGGACPKFDVAAGKHEKLPVSAPDPFGERAALIEPLRAGLPGRSNGVPARVLGVPEVGACAAVLPWLCTFLGELGFGVRVLSSSARSLAKGEALCYSFDACAPVKAAHGVLDAELDEIFFPKVLALPDADGPGGPTCPMEQALPETIREALRARGRAVRIHHPVLSLSGPHETRGRELADAAVCLGVSKRAARRAAARADLAQRRFEHALAAIGWRALAWARERDLPTVVLAGPTHVLHDRAVNADIPRVLRESGVLAMPMECFPIPASTPPLPRVVWADANRALRVAVAARAAGDVYPILLSSFGCGPASFAETLFAALCEGYPHSALESDGHGGTAGFVTRIQAFLHSVRAHDRRSCPAPAHRLRLCEQRPEPPLAEDRDRRLVMLSVGDRLSSVLTASYRAAGLDVVASPPTSASALALGRRDCSGKECLPYQLLWGTFREHLEAHPPDRPTLLVQVQGEGMCRNCMFSIKDQLSLERLGLGDRVGVRHMSTDASVGAEALTRVFAGVQAWDLLYQLASYHRPAEPLPGAVDRLYASLCDELLARLAVPIAEEPGRFGLRSGVRVARILAGADGVGALIDHAASAFARLAGGGRTADDRTVLLTGDIYLRLDPFGSDQLVRRCNDRGLRVIVEPTSVLSEYMASERLGELLGLPKHGVANVVARAGMARLRRELSGRVRRLHPWLPAFEPRAAAERAQQLIDRYPRGEAPITIGSVLHHLANTPLDGVVVVSPWGCGPALVAEGLLRHVRDVPMLFIYCDGSPLPDRRLDAFSFQLRRTRRPAPRAARG